MSWYHQSDGTIIVDKETDQAASNITGENVVNMLARFNGDISKQHGLSIRIA